MRGVDRLTFGFSPLYGLAVYPPGETFGPRTLLDFEFVWIIDGDAVFEADGVAHPAPSGTVILSRPGMRDGYIWDAKRTSRHGFFHFTIERNGVELPPEHDWPLLRQMRHDDVLLPLFHHLDWLLTTHPPEWELLAPRPLAQGLPRPRRHRFGDVRVAAAPAPSVVAAGVAAVTGSAQRSSGGLTRRNAA